MKIFVIIFVAAFFMIVPLALGFAQYGSSVPATGTYGTGVVGSTGAATGTSGIAMGYADTATGTYGTATGTYGTAVVGSTGAATGTSGIAMNVVDSSDALRGRIVAIDPVKNKIVIRQLTTGEERTFTVTPEEIIFLTVGQWVRVQFDPQSNAAESIKSTVYKEGRWWNF
jgi:hypothetical protein